MMARRAKFMEAEVAQPRPVGMTAEQRFVYWKDAFKTELLADLKQLRRRPVRPSEPMLAEIAGIADRIGKRIQEGGVRSLHTIDSAAWVALAQEFGIDNTYETWEAYFKGAR